LLVLALLLRQKGQPHQTVKILALATTLPKRRRRGVAKKTDYGFARIVGGWSMPIRKSLRSTN
jgi:phosphoenolpyruvate carboxylase